MLFDAGTAIIRRGKNKASAGEMPVIVYDRTVATSYYGEKTVGVTRYWTAKAHDARADLLIEIPRSGAIRPQDQCELKPFTDTGAAGKYKILQIQHLLDEDGLPVTDLTLERIEAIDDA